MFVFAILLAAHCYFLNEYPQFHHPNTYSRLYLTLAIAEQGRFSVDDQVARYGLVQDIARYKSHYFSDKAPGLSMMLAPIAWVLRHTLIPPSNSATSMLVALRLLGVSIPVVLFWFLTRRTWYELAGGTERGLAVILAGALGTSFFIYATQLFAHVPAAMLVFTGYLLIRREAIEGTAERGRSFGRIAAAGFCIGSSCITDYILVLAVPVLFAYAVLARPQGRGWRAAALIAGVLPPVLIGAWYAYACFENPFAIGSHYVVDPHFAAAYGRGLLGIQAPDWRGLAGMTILPKRGVCYLAPVLLLAPVGWYHDLRRRESWASTLVAILVVLAIVFFAITTVDWESGWSVGSRYMVPAIPFLLTGVAAAVRKIAAGSVLAVALRALASVGVVVIALAAASFPCFPQEFENPVWQLSLPMLQAGYMTPNTLRANGLVDDLLPFALIATTAIAFIIGRSWPEPTKRPSRAIVFAVVAAAIVLLTMRQTAPPADGAQHQVAIRNVLYRMGY